VNGARVSPVRVEAPSGAAARGQRLAYAATLLQLAITVPLAFILDLGNDDMYTLNTSGHGVAYAFHQAIFFEQNAPLYFVVMAIWRLVNGGYVWARLFSVACAALVVYVTPRLSERYLPRISRGWLTLAVAVNPMLIWAALDIRDYALVMLLAALLMLAFHDAFIAERPSRWSLAVYGVLCAVGAYTQYFLLFIVAAQGLSLVWLRRWGAMGRYVAVGAMAALAFAPMLLVLPYQLASFRAAFAPPASPLAMSSTLGRILIRYVFPLPDAVLSHRGYELAYYAAILLAAVIGGIAARRRMVRPGGALAAGIFAASFVLFALALYEAKAPIATRHAAMLFVPVMLAAFAVPTALREPARERAAIALALLIIGSSAVTLAATYRHGSQLGDWRRVAAYLEAHERPGQPILVFEAESSLPLSYFYRGPNPIVPLPAPVQFDTYDSARFVLHNGAEISAALARVPGAHPTIWLAFRAQCSWLNLDYGCGVLERYVKENYQTLSKVQFYGSELQLLRRRDAPVSMPRHALDRR